MFRKALFIVLVSLSLTSCMTLADYDFSAINYSLYEQNYEDAYNLVEADKKILYGDKGQVLYDLDRGILSHYGFVRNQCDSNNQFIFDERHGGGLFR